MELSRILEGYEKQINALKKSGLMKVNEGKRHLKSSGYFMLASKLMKAKPEKKGQSWASSVFMWSYFVLMWNLMSRSDSIDSIMLQHIKRAEDYLVVEEQGHKGDQTGSDKFGKHVYANPYEPTTCPILALAVLLFSYPERSNRSRQQLFLGTDNKNRFGRVLRQMVADLNEDELQLLGCDSEDIGTHSLRKGSSIYALGQVGGPSPVSVYLRMGQSLGKLKDRYIHFAEGADQLCGRMIAELPFDSERFGVLPPHFEPTLRCQLSLAFWNGIMTGYNFYPRGLQAAFPFLLASLFYHEQFLRETLDRRHPIFTSRAFSANPLLSQLWGAPILTTGISITSGLKATGIPPHLAIAKTVGELATALCTIKRKLEELKLQQMTTLPKSIATMVSEELRQAFVVGGVAPITLRDLDRRMQGMRDQVVADLQQIITASLARLTEALPQPSTTTDEAGDHVWKSWNYDDGLLGHCVPKNWEFPVGDTVKAMWNLWHYGDQSTGIRPYRQLTKKFDIQPKHHMRHSRAKVVMAFLERVIDEEGILPSGSACLAALPPTERDEVFTRAYGSMLRRLYNVLPARADVVTLSTMYSRGCSHRKENL